MLKIFFLLSVVKGLVLVMAPRRGNTLELFLQLCQGKFQICLEEDYDSVVTLLHQKVNSFFFP